MPIYPGRAVAALLLAFSSSPLTAQILPPPVLPASTPAPADLTLGGYPVLVLRGAAGGLSPGQRIDVIMGRLTPLLGIPYIQPSDVVVYLPSPASRVNRYPVIYALGHRLITVDPATVQAAGSGKTPLETAELWARRLQQILPRVNWRPPNAPEPKIPTHPPLTITRDLTHVGGQMGPVFLRGKLILKVRGPQPGGLTAAERADMLTARLNALSGRAEASAPDGVQVTTLPDGTAQLALAGTPLVTVTASDAAAADFPQPVQLAEGWAKNLRAALAPPVLPETPASAETPAAAPTEPPAPMPEATPANPPPAPGG